MLLPVPDFGNVSSISPQIVEGTDVHQPEHDNSSISREDLEILGVLDVTEAEDDAEEAEDEN